MDIVWTLLAGAFWFIVAFLSLLWLAGQAYGDSAPRGPWLLIVLVLASGFVAYVMVSHGPIETECVETSPRGSGRC